MTLPQIGYVRRSTDKQDLTAQRKALIALRVKPNCLCNDYGLTCQNQGCDGDHAPS